jgi:hypothetical protein
MPTIQPNPTAPGPGPGQTITGGSWTGPDGQTQPPAPVPLGQNQSLRLKLGMAKPAGYAKGISKVPAKKAPQPPMSAQPPGAINQGNPMMPGFAFGTPEVPEGPTPPKPGDTETTGDWGTGGQNQDLRRKLGLGRGMLSLAQGTPDVPSAPTQPVVLPAQAPLFPAPVVTGSLPLPMVRGQPGGSVPPGFVLPNSLQGFNAPPDPGIPPQFIPAPAPAFPGAPTLRGAGGGFASAPVAPAMASGGTAVTPTAPVRNVPNPAPNGKRDDNPSVTAALADQHGVTPEQIHAGTQTHQYSEDEYVNALRGIPLGAYEKIYQMQHYLTPQQALIPRAVAGADRTVTEAQTQAQEALKGNDPAALKTAQDTYKKAYADREALIQRLAFNSPWFSPQPQGQ